ncbi:MAG: polysaccharide biosynthesis protein [Methanomassiliicoccus sp.]|nr:polysaccharide biosynthesis protein [Methanomassiliicoccus sp.]
MSDAPVDIKFAQRFPRNLLTNVVYFTLSIVVGLLLVPFFIGTLGTAAYGLIPLATSITSYITIVIDSLNLSISRYLTVDLQRGDMGKASETFSTALIGILAFVLVLTPFLLVAAWYAPSFFNIGDQAAGEVFLLFAMVFGSMLVTAWGASFTVVLFAHNRLDLRNYVYTVNLAVQLVTVVLFFLSLGPSLALVGLSYLLASIVSVGVAAFLASRVCPGLRLSRKLFVRSRMHEISIMSSWVLFNGIGLLLNTQVALFIVNKIFGEVSGSEYALAVVWGSLLVSIAGLLTNLFTPMTYSYYARQDHGGLVSFTTMAVKISGLLMALPVALVCVFSSLLLTLWVGPEFAHLAPLVWILVAPVILQIMVSCISPITVAYDRVKGLVFLTLPLGIANILLAVLFSYTLGIGMYGVALAGLVTLIIRYGLVNPVFIASVVHVPLLTYVRKMFFGVGAVALLSLAGIVVTSLIGVTTLPMLLIVAGVISGAYLLMMLKLGLSPKERELIQLSLPGMLQKVIPAWLFH